MREWASTALNESHDCENFDCGIESLNVWLREHALRAQRSDTARTYVWTPSKNTQVVAYFSIAPTQIVRDEVPRSVAGGYSVIPGYILARLALDNSLRGQKLGSELLVDAVGRIVGVSEVVAGRVIVVDAIDDGAASFYEHHDFKPVKGNPLRLIMTMTTARRTLSIG